MKSYDFIAVGDIVTDAFIRLKDAKVNCDINDDNCTITMRFGDKIPYEQVMEVKAVGNAANASVAAARLGLDSALVTDLGDDQHGADIVDKLRAEKVGTDFVTVHPGKTSNYHYVLWYEDDRTILVKHEEFDYRWPTIPAAPAWLYFSSLSENSLAYHQALADYVKANPEVKLAFQPGTFQIKLGAKKLQNIYEASEIVFMNTEEARRVLETKETDVKKLLTSLRQLGPKMAVVTDGKAGAYLATDEGNWFIPPYPDPKPPLDRTGAGDAFASTFTAALALGETPETALTWAPINSMSVVQYVGAQEGLLTKSQLLDYLAKAPADYHPKKLS
ncbi:MAG: hypothetical protein A2114_01315 [Candidatus Vogelbacteria bacterium GWA1_51_14]|uniref:Carbohydrate kinase PfkB domain-containing protein n=1 Tax=Candidatus Vogelbacteria bacterium GWA1_51_14 TaxID=1802435 RepID=A0A1G2QAH1_9BACT|nr:MAG: hypothetical protein A2114_01315 [Candidatus Vogelbacteria bacterium GWA1_51_14]